MIGCNFFMTSKSHLKLFVFVLEIYFGKDYSRELIEYEMCKPQ